MAQRKPDDQVSLEQVLQLVERLSVEDQHELRRKLESKSWGHEWRQLQSEIEARRLREGLPALTEEEILAEIKTVKEERRARRVEGSN
jgi:hypothetical protein